jgi:hypothetical protein
VSTLVKGDDDDGVEGDDDDEEEEEEDGAHAIAGVGHTPSSLTQ